MISRGRVGRIAGVGGGAVLTAALLLAGTVSASAEDKPLELVGFGSSNHRELLVPAGAGGYSVPTKLELAGTALEGKSAADVRVSSWGTGTLLTTGGEVYTWGANYYGSTGTGTSGPDNISYIDPTRVSFAGTALEGRKITKIETNSAGGFALADNGRIAGWGANGWSERGPSATGLVANAPVDVPVAGTVLEGKTPTEIISVRGGTFVKTSDGGFYGWGATSTVNPGALGTVAKSSAVPASITFAGTPLEGKKIADIINTGDEGYAILDPIGDYPIGSLLALTTDGETYSWGQTRQGSLGQGVGVAELRVPTRIDALSQVKVRELVQGDSTVVGAISESGDLYTWGVNRRGNAGVGSNIDVAVPTKVNLPAPVRSVGATAGHMVTVLTNDEIWSWGRQHVGQTGVGVNATDRLVPQRVDVTGTPLEGVKIHSILGGYASTVVRLGDAAAPVDPTPTPTPTEGPVDPTPTPTAGPVDPTPTAGPVDPTPTPTAPGGSSTDPSTPSGAIDAGSAGSGSGLANTGAVVWPFAGGALVLLAAGAFMAYRTRKLTAS